MSGRTRAIAGIRALALAVVVLALLTGTLPHGSPRASAAPLTPGSDFTISSALSSSPTSPGSPAALVPGVTRYLWYTVSNPLPEPITVTSLSIVRVDAPAACPASNLDTAGATFTGTLVVPARGARTAPTPVPISLVNLPDVNQDACKNVTFTFTYTGTGWYTDATPPTVTRIATATTLASGPNPVSQRELLTLTASVAGAPGAAQPTGTVSFYRGTPGGARTLLGTRTLGPGATARLVVGSLPAGAVSLYAVYGGSATMAGSASPVATQTVIGPPAECTGTYPNWIIATPGTSVIRGTRGNDFIYAVGGNHRVKAGKGNDCVVVGDGNNRIWDGSGADAVIAGNGRNRITLTGSRNTLLVGDGDGNRVLVRGTRKKKSRKTRKTNGNIVTIGDGNANRVTVRRGSGNQVTVGSGAKNRIKVRKRGSRNQVAIGNGDGNRITVRKGYRNRVLAGGGARNRLWVKGTRNTVTVGHGARNRVIVKGRKGLVAIGDGDRNRITLKGKRHRIAIGDGDRNRLSVRRGYKGRITIGDGDRNRAVVRGKRHRIVIGDGDRNRLIVRRGYRSRITIGDGPRNRVTVTGSRSRMVIGQGTGNRIRVRGSRRGTTCSLPAPPPVWGGSPARFYRDTIRRCRVVTR